MNHDKYQEYWDSLPWHIKLRNTIYFWFDMKFNNSRKLKEAYHKLEEWFI